MSDVRLNLRVADKLNIDVKQVRATVELLDEGGTIPFISRYRKEATGSLDEVQIMQIRDEIERLRQLESRRAAIIKSIEGQGKLTEELRDKIDAAENLSQLEDLYLPYKPKRRTKATIAREKGLEPLAQKILLQENFDLDAEALQYVNEEKEVKNIMEALQGARDIIAEIVSENAESRAQLRNLFQRKAIIKSRVIRGKEEEGEKFKDYLTEIRAYAIDMETATIFTVGFYNKIPTGALLLVSDSPMIPEGVKTEASDSKVTAQFVERHLTIGIESLKQLINNGQTVRHLQF